MTRWWLDLCENCGKSPARPYSVHGRQIGDEEPHNLILLCIECTHKAKYRVLKKEKLFDIIAFRD
jgi:hypothetical protein